MLGISGSGYNKILESYKLENPVINDQNQGLIATDPENLDEITLVGKVFLSKLEAARTTALGVAAKAAATAEAETKIKSENKKKPLDEPAINNQNQGLIATDPENLDEITLVGKVFLSKLKAANAVK